MSTFSALVLATLAFAEGSEATRARVVLVAPTPHTITPLRQGVELPESSADAMRTQIFVEVLDFDGQVEDTPLRGTWGAGVVRRGTVLPAVRKRPRQGCGLWAALPDGGGFCSGRGVVFHATPALAQALTIAPDLDADLPYRYGEVTEAGTIRYARLPTVDELAAAENGELDDSVPHSRTSGAVYVAIDRPQHVGDVMLYRTVEGDYVQADRIRPVASPPTAGQPLIEAELPVAFVHVADAPVLVREGEALREVGVAQRTARARARVDGIRALGEGNYVELQDGRLLRRDDVRLAEAIDPPPGIGSDERWIHVNLAEQLLVAYEGARPVYVTLISSGKKGSETPTGRYRIRRKYVSRRMKGPDPDTGSFDLGEVPWAMYYQGGLALHAAYWHDDFGHARSHGCINTPPEAARWLFRWASPRVPDGWHGRIAPGTRVVITRR